MAREPRLLLAASSCAFALAAAPLPTAAQLAPALIQPVEVRTCDFNDGKGPRDIDALATELDRFLNESGAPRYDAFALFPQIHSSEIDFDLTWVGVWPDGITMGEGMARRFANGAEMTRAFDSVMHCRDIRNFSMLTLRAAEDRAHVGPVEVTTCKLRLGVGNQAAIQAAREWVDYTATVGSRAAHWLLFPAYGERSDASYNFKWVVGYDSYESFGRDYDQLTNGGALDRYNELFQFLLRCDSPRLYGARAVRVQ